MLAIPGRLKDHPSEILIGFLTLVVIAGILISIPSLSSRWWLVPILVSVLLLGFHFLRTFSSLLRAAWSGYALAVIIAFGVNAAGIMGHNIAATPEFDIQVFWLHGQVARQNQNFYEPAAYQQFTDPASHSEGFRNEVLEVGSVYPPPTMFLFAPLGYFDLPTATLLWYLANSLVFGIVCVTLWRLFLADTGAAGLILSAALCMILPAALRTVNMGQTHFLAILFLALFLHDRSRPRGGVWLAIGILIKPILAGILLYLLLRQNWRSLMYVFATLAILSILSIVIFGPTTFFSYFTMNPTSKLPPTMYTFNQNQSLQGIILALTGYTEDAASPVKNPIFIVSASIMLAFTAWLISRRKQVPEDWALMLALTLSAVLYPHMTPSLSVLLIVPVLLLWRDRRIFPRGVWLVTAFSVLIYAVSAYQWGDLNVIVNVLTWIVCVCIAVWMIRWQNTPRSVAPTAQPAVTSAAE